MSEATDTSTALREEVRHLLGLSWDRFLEWTIITWLSAWIWTAWSVSNAVVVPDSGPIAWIADVITAFGGKPPTWLSDIPVWLTDTHRAALLPICVVASAILVTLSLRSYRLTGLRVLALGSAAVAVEIDGSVLPLLWIVAVAAVPCAASIVASFLPGDNDGLLDDREWGFFHIRSSIVLFVLRVVGLYLMPLVAPGVLAAALVFSYRVESRYQPAQSLGRASAGELAAASSEQKTVAESDPLVLMSAIVSAISSTLPEGKDQGVAAAFDSELRKRRKPPIGGIPRVGRSL